MVTGLGCITSLGASRDAFVSGIVAGQSGIRRIEDFDVSSSRAQHAGRLSGFDATKYLPPLKLRRVDAVARVAIAATRDALDDAGFPHDAAGYDTIGVVLGSFSAGVHATGEYLESFLKGGPTGAPALLFSSTVGNAPASHCGLEYGLRGPNTTLMHKEASGLSAIVFATHLIRRGKASAVVAGGADDIYERFYRVHDWFGVMADSRHPGAPGDAMTGASEGSSDSAAVDTRPIAMPFDAARRGFVMGEGGFMLVLEDGASAAARGARVLAEVLGTSSSASSVAINAWPSDDVALVRAMRLAIEDAGIAADDVDVVYAAANGTAPLDRVEAAGIREVFGGRDVPVTSIKGAIGEFGAAAAGSAAAAILCGRQGAIAPTVGFQTPAADCPVRVVSPTAPLPKPGAIVLVNSFASGGTNFSVVLRLIPA
jgi:3-oxoacyl-[acyl-carrier-protein] synthase II